MKAWFSWCHMFPDLEEGGYNVKFGIDWYRHKSLVNKRFRGWRGFSIIFYLIKYQITFNIVDDYEAYEYRVNYRWTKERLDGKNEH